MRAIILLNSDNAKTRTNLNILRQRAGLLPLTGTITQQHIDNEYMKELSFE
ncbi:hypothetical protein [Jejuia pallidilutea]|uniref:hypothetical protein n=1 Tax=Jejuia pallidilutea TaxID=504487 RepID=UPI001475FC0C|nr:hypothetical protein [Jejuia pallidilutea]